MNTNPNVVMSKADVNRMILCLKNLDVRGYDSMYRVVATVEFLEGLLSEPPKGNKKAEVDHEFVSHPTTG